NEGAHAYRSDESWALHRIARARREPDGSRNRPWKLTGHVGHVAISSLVPDESHSTSDTHQFNWHAPRQHNRTRQGREGRSHFGSALLETCLGVFASASGLLNGDAAFHVHREVRRAVERVLARL